MHSVATHTSFPQTLNTIHIAARENLKLRITHIGRKEKEYRIKQISAKALTTGTKSNLYKARSYFL